MYCPAEPKAKLLPPIRRPFCVLRSTVASVKPLRPSEHRQAHDSKGRTSDGVLPQPEPYHHN